MAGGPSSRAGERLRIVVIHSRRERPARMEAEYLIGDFSAAWRRAGHSVVHVAGTQSLPDGDIAIVHVDLSVVPDGYAAAALLQYPVVLNGRIRDIRKSRVSQAIAPPGFAGPVIVKTDGNYGGAPEARALPPWRRWFGRIAIRAADRGLAGGRYPIYASLSAVPRRLRGQDQLVVERFLPERAGGTFFLRQTLFLAGRDLSWRLSGNVPVLRAAEATGDEEVPTPSAIRAYAAGIGLDYGKIDYLEVDGEPVVIDVAKTIGGRGSAPDSVARLAGAIDDLRPP